MKLNGKGCGYKREYGYVCMLIDFRHLRFKHTLKLSVVKSHRAESVTFHYELHAKSS